jgi:alpha-tubulin suppressor-like RCC1 family protein
MVLGAKHSCLLSNRNDVVCFGDNSKKQCGVCSNTTSNCLGNNGKIGALQGAESISTGYYTTCALMAKKAFCWGNNSHNQITPEAGSTNANPTAIPNKLFDQISPGHTHTCGLGTDSIVYCWGNNFYGQLGEGTNTSQNQPTGVKGLE